MPHYQEAEKFVNAEFWPRSFDKRSTLDISKLVGEKLKADDAAKDPEYYNHREGVVHVTSLTRCLRGVVLEMLGAKPDKEVDTRKLGVFKAGNLFEDFVLDAMGDRVIERQREYVYQYKGLTVVGRSDGLMNDESVHRVIEDKSVHSDSFWYREKEGTLVAWHNQVQLQTYMWLERQLFGNEYDGMFTYVSKDDVTVKGCAVKFNQAIIDQIVIPTLDTIAAAYAAKDPMLAVLPPPVVYNEAKHQYQKNWIATYCEYHNQCAGPGWLLEAGDEVTRRNKEAKASLSRM